MYHPSILLVVLLVVSRGRADTGGAGDDVPFDANYKVTWGNEHVMSLNQGREIQLSMLNFTGSGFGSKLSYGSGLFQMRIKLHDKDTAGVVTTFYLTSNTNNHDELDWEFLGNSEGKPITVQTNIYVNGIGNKEQRMWLWFDPAADFHTYKILWNQHQIVFYVDDVPIRVLKNNTDKGVSYPSQAMQIQGTIWNGDSWATDGGRTKINWSHAPFKAHFQGFNINGCPAPEGSANTECYSSNYAWNDKPFWDLGANEQKRYEDVRKKYMYYDYCTDKSRYSTTPPECV